MTVLVQYIDSAIYHDTGSKVDYFMCIFNELLARAFFCSLGSGKSLIAVDELVMYKNVDY